ncbi:MAG: hypothetical protein AAFO58_13300, partial [Pseudomonadota bacterium]
PQTPNPKPQNPKMQFKRGYQSKTEDNPKAISPHRKKREHFLFLFPSMNIRKYKIIIFSLFSKSGASALHF